MSAIWAVQVAALQRWKADPRLAAKVTGVYDGAAPADTPYPYIVVGQKTEAPRGALGAVGWNATLTAHIWSTYDGDKEGVEILALMHAALREPLALNGHGSARLKPEQTLTLIERGGVRHFPIRYRILAWENA